LAWDRSTPVATTTCHLMMPRRKLAPSWVLSTVAQHGAYKAQRLFCRPQPGAGRELHHQRTPSDPHRCTNIPASPRFPRRVGGGRQTAPREKNYGRAIVNQGTMAARDQPPLIGDRRPSIKPVGRTSEGKVDAATFRRPTQTRTYVASSAAL
jgi:hypothetical protein